MFYRRTCAFSISAKGILANLPGFHSNVSVVTSVASESALMLSSSSFPELSEGSFTLCPVKEQ